MSKYFVKTGKSFDRDIQKIVIFSQLRGYDTEKITEMLDKIYTDLRSLSEFPNLGAALNSKTKITNDFRYLLCGNYFVFYEVEKKHKVVKIYHICHYKENYLSILGLK